MLTKCPRFWKKRGILTEHSVPIVDMTLKISRRYQTPNVRWEWVVGITLHAQFCQIPSPLIVIFSKICFQLDKLTNLLTQSGLSYILALMVFLTIRGRKREIFTR